MWEHHGMLVEAIGPVHITFRLRADAGDLVFDTVGCRVLGLPLPRYLWPRICVRASSSLTGPDPIGRFGIFVELSLPLLGRIVEYTGEMRQIAAAAAAAADERKVPKP